MLINFFKKRLEKQNKVLLKNSSWVFSSNVYGAILAFFRSVLIARGLGVEIFGTYLIVMAFIATVLQLFNLNVGVAIIKFGAEYKSENRFDKLAALVKGCLFANLGGIFLALSFILIVSLFFYDSFIPYPELEFYLFLLAVAEATTLVNVVSRSLLRLFYKFKLNSIIQIVIDSIEFFLIAAALYFFPKNISVFFIVIISSRIINSLVINVSAALELKPELGPYLKSKLNLLKDQFKTIRNYIIQNSLGNSLKTLKDKGDVLLLGFLAGNAPVAYYSIGKRVAYSILTITDPLTSSIFPQLSKLVAEKKYVEIIAMLKQSTRMLILPSLVFLVAAYFLKEWFIVLVFGQEYRFAALPCFYLLIISVQSALLFWNLSLIQSLNLVRSRLIIYFISIIAGALTALVLVPKLEAVGMAISLALSNFIIDWSFVYLSTKRLYKAKLPNEHKET